MHYAKRICISWGKYPKLNPEDVPDFAPHGNDVKVRIEWVHKDNSGKPDIAASRRAAEQMVAKYGIINTPVAPPYSSRHNIRPSNAIDIPINAITIPLNCIILKSNGEKIKINRFSDIYSVGESYGVRKLLSDPPHWSNDGH